MSDKIPVYESGNSLPVTLDAFRNRPCGLPYSHENYRPPEPSEVKALVKLMGWSQSNVAKLVGVTYNPKKGSTTVRKWQTDKGSAEYREIPYSAWRHLLVCARVVTVDEELAALERGAGVNCHIN